MIFKRIQLENFRNYGSLSLDLDEKLNLFLGENAQGKTNLLESLFIMGMGKSFRTNNDKEMIGFGGERARAEAVILDDGGREVCVDITYSKEGKLIRVDGIKLDRTIDLLENVYVVIFSPDDLKIIKDGPDNRRRFLDRELCQIKPVYYSDLGSYKKVLKQRNMLLRQNCSDRDLFDVFDESLADYGTRIVVERTAFVKRIEEISKRIHSDISGGREVLSVSYETKIDTDPSVSTAVRKEAYKELLKKSFDSDLQKGYTGFGPHKDDLRLEIDGVDIRLYGSQGQQRTASLSLKLAEIGLITTENGKNAVLLLDDVLSELDQSRQRYLIEAMSDVQIFLTATGIEEPLQRMLPAGKSFFVSGGNVLT